MYIPAWFFNMNAIKKKAGINQKASAESGVRPQTINDKLF